jgi:hypothetical protein
MEGRKTGCGMTINPYMPDVKCGECSQFCWGCESLHLAEVERARAASHASLLAAAKAAVEFIEFATGLPWNEQKRAEILGVIDQLTAAIAEAERGGV